MVKQKDIPELRFSGFDGEWVKIRLGDDIKISSGNSPSLYNLSDVGQYPFIKVEELNNCDKYQFVSRFYTDYMDGVIEPFSIIFPKRGAAILNNKVRINSVPLIMDSNLMAIKPLSNKLDYEFLYYIITREKLYKIADTSTIPQINNKHIEPYRLYIPSTFEQQKIASFFTAIDLKITQLKQKHELLEQYKKGVMQKIFNQQIRFRDDDGREFPKWTEKKLGDLGTILMCKRVFAEQTQEIGEVPFYKIGTIGGVADAYITKKLFIQYKSKYNYPKKGQTLITCSGTVGKCVQFDGHDSYYQDSNIIWIDNSDEDVLDDFLYILLSNYKWGKLNSTTITRIYTNDLKILKFRFPCITEQTKIANFLSAIDDKIQHTQRQVDQTEQWKKGLMQRMFV